MLTFVLAADGTPLMPTYNIKKVRKLLKTGKAVIAGHKPGFTIRLLYEVKAKNQDVEVTVDAGAQHIGISAKSEKHEYVHRQYDLLTDEKQKHDDCRQQRRMRRGRLRYRKPRFDNRKRDKGWLAPSLANKRDRHTDLVKDLKKVLPVTSVVIEVGSFDTQYLETLETGAPLPEGKDYQRGPMYEYDTRREAMFYRDKHTCQLCGRSAIEEKNVILRMHHLGYWKGDHSDRMKNLITLCTKCHSPKNHKKSGALYGWEPKLNRMDGAAFMNAVRWQVVDKLKELGVPVSVTYGSATKRERLNSHIEKTHANDAYCMGRFRPKHRVREEVFAKRRRNNRILEKFYDAVYADTRDGTKKKAAELPCGRTRRSEPRNGSDNLRIYRGRRLKAGKRSVRRNRYALRPGDMVMFESRRFTVKGVHCKGKNVILSNGKSVAVSKVKVVYHTGAYKRVL